MKSIFFRLLVLHVWLFSPRIQLYFPSYVRLFDVNLTQKCGNALILRLANDGLWPCEVRLWGSRWPTAPSSHSGGYARRPRRLLISCYQVVKKVTRHFSKFYNSIFLVQNSRQWRGICTIIIDNIMIFDRYLASPSCLEVRGLTGEEVRETLFEMTFFVEFSLL